MNVKPIFCLYLSIRKKEKQLLEPFKQESNYNVSTGDFGSM